MRLLSAVLLPLACVALLLGTARAAERENPFDHKFTFLTGTVLVGEDIATIDLPAGYRFLGEKDAVFVIERLWGNPPMGSIRGMVLPPTPEKSDKTEQPDRASPRDNVMEIADIAWGMVITWNTGHVTDSSLSNLDPIRLLDTTQKANLADNVARQKMHYPSVDILGWAEPPRYDAKTHVLTWGTSLRFHSTPAAMPPMPGRRRPILDSPVDQKLVNYSARLLAGQGVLELTTVADLENLPTIVRSSKDLFKRTTLVPGNRYDDYNFLTDPVYSGDIDKMILGLNDPGHVDVGFGFGRMIAWFVITLLVIGGLVLAVRHLLPLTRPATVTGGGPAGNATGGTTRFNSPATATASTTSGPRRCGKCGLALHSTSPRCPACGASTLR